MMNVRRQKGVVLVLVLWSVVLLTVIAGAVTVTRSNSISMITNTKMHREGRALVDAGFYFMMLNLGNIETSPAAKYWKVDGELHPWIFADHEIWIGAIPESSLIDLNYASPELLRGLFVSVGIAIPDAQQLADSILDWRDKDSSRHLHGIEDPGYRAEGRPVGAADQPFQSVEELRQVAGVSVDIYHLVKSSLTVDSRQSTVNPVFAPRSVLAALPGMTQAGVDAYIEQRRGALANGIPAPMPPGVDPQIVRVGSMSAFRLYSEVTAANGVTTQGEALVRVDKLSYNGYQIESKNFTPTWVPPKSQRLVE